jgi:tetratricopeptide (TPR) repeat protein
MTAPRLQASPSFWMASSTGGAAAALLPGRWAQVMAMSMAVSAGLLLGTASLAQTQTQSPAEPGKPQIRVQLLTAAAEVPTQRSALDANLFYQLLVAEAELRRGESSAAYQLVIEAARRTRDEALFRRAVDIALRSRSSEQALAAVKAWRTSQPRSSLAAQTQAQVLLALGRTAEAAEPLRAMVELSPPAERTAAIAVLPRLIPRSEQSRAAAQLLDDVLKPYRDNPATRATALVAGARAFAGAGDAARALQLAADAQRDDAAADGPALIALELMKEPAAEPIVQRYLKAQPDARHANPVRLAYVRQLTAAQRYSEAAAQLGELTQSDPSFAPAWLTLGALQIELGQPREAQASLQRFVALREARQSPPAGNDKDTDKDNDDEDDERAQREADDARQELTQAYLMLAQSSEQLRDFAGAQSWLEKLGEVGGGNTVVARRASLLMRQGKRREALELIRSLPEATPEEARSKVMSESQLLREAQEWTAAHDLLATANKRFGDDADLLYEQAMMAEKLRRFDDMERLLRKVIELRADFHHAYNALGYSLADRNVRLPEARQLVAKALELSPGDPFITDSLGWVEFRLGNRPEALRLLRDAYGKRPDPEIAAHLGEVLWASGLGDEARRVWREARARDAANDVLKETLARLKVSL